MLNIEVKNMQSLVKTSYSTSDVVVLLKDLTNVMEELPASVREQRIQSGQHYSTMLPKEDAPSESYMKLYESALSSKSNKIAKGIAKISEIAVSKHGEPVIVSLARAGIPVGILMKRYIKQKYNIDCQHYAISIIRDIGIDENAMEFIYEQLKDMDVSKIIFVDGWTGKGMIKMQLDEAVKHLKEKDAKWSKLSSDLYVLADPANITKFCGTRNDFLLPSACLNSTVSGLISRTILDEHINVKNGDFHGAVYFARFEDIDKSNEFIDTVSNEFKYIKNIDATPVELDDYNGLKETMDICKIFDIADFKKVKPGVGETTRVLLRRVPWLVLINKNLSSDCSDIQHILMLCKAKDVPISRLDLGNYKTCGIIKDLSADA